MRPRAHAARSERYNPCVTQPLSKSALERLARRRLSPVINHSESTASAHGWWSSRRVRSTRCLYRDAGQTPRSSRIRSETPRNGRTSATSPDETACGQTSRSMFAHSSGDDGGSVRNGRPRPTGRQSIDVELAARPLRRGTGLRSMIAFARPARQLAGLDWRRSDVPAAVRVASLCCCKFAVA